MTYTEWVDYMTEQGVTESEIIDLIDFFNLQKDTIGNKDGWEIKYIPTAEEWVRDICDSIKSDYGDVGSFLKLHYLSDYGEFASNYAEYLMDDYGDALICYCPSTERVIVFKSTYYHQ